MTDDKPELRPIAGGKLSGSSDLPPGGGDIEARLRSLEINVARIDERKISIHENSATKADIANLKIWFLLIAFTLGIAAAGAASAVIVAITGLLGE
ncbi:MAG: hypothetical protein OXC63_03750 [Aestuariivita sp.]|nr:hypothetical protein [Aestuariivita sp.]MCY4346976.1 hypothetical protein [Aestuariivita sp.]